MKRIIKAGKELIKYMCKDCKRDFCWDDDCKLIKELKDSIDDFEETEKVGGNNE